MPSSPRTDPTADHPKLRDGYHFFPHQIDGEEVWHLLEPNGVFVRLHIPPDSARRLGAVFGGQTPPTEGSQPLSELLTRFEQRAYLAPVERSERSTNGSAVAVLGATPISSLVGELLELSGAKVWRGELTARLPKEIHAVIACAGWLSDQAFRRLDESCRERSIPFQVAYAEGTRFFVGPLVEPDYALSPSYEDARMRRLAAADHPDLLEAYWQYLETGDNVPSVPWPDAAGLAAIAAAAVSPILAASGGLENPVQGHQLAFDPSTWEWRRHSVLPVPKGILVEAIE